MPSFPSFTLVQVEARTFGKTAIEVGLAGTANAFAIAPTFGPTERMPGECVAESTKAGMFTFAATGCGTASVCNAGACGASGVAGKDGSTFVSGVETAPGPVTMECVFGS